MDEGRRYARSPHETIYLCHDLLLEDISVSVDTSDRELCRKLRRIMNMFYVPLSYSSQTERVA